MTPSSYISTYPRYLASERAQRKSEHTVRAYSLALRKFESFLMSYVPNESSPGEVPPESNEPTDRKFARSANSTSSPTANLESNEITALTVLDWRTELYESGLGQNTVHQYLASLSRFFDWAARFRLIDENPIPKGEIPHAEFQKQQIPTKQEIMKLLQTKPYTLVSKKPIRNYAIVAFILCTGLRSDEVRETRLSDLNFAKEYVRVRCGKGGKERTVPFPPRAQTAVREYLAAGIRPEWCTDEDYLFGITRSENSAQESETDEPNETNGPNEMKVWHKWDATTLGRVVHRYCRSVIGKDVHPHTLRHCAASLWDDKGADMREVQRSLGHSSIRTTERVYLHILDENQAAANISRLMKDI